MGAAAAARRRPPHRPAPVHLDLVRRPAGGARVPARPPRDGDDPRGLGDWGAHPPLLDRVHAGRDGRGVRPLLLVPQPVRRFHARPRAGAELPRDVRRVGGRRPLLLPADRVLVQEAVGLGRRQEGLHRQPDRRLRLPARRAAALLQVRQPRLPAARHARSPRSRRKRRSGRSRSPRCCSSSARQASRPRFPSTCGCPTRWKARPRCRR